MTQNAYFTYVAGKTPGGDEYAHRTNVQEWIVNLNAAKLIIYVQGPMPNGQHNAFAKKHLMTTTGGTFAGSPKGKISSISAKRRTDTIASTNQSRQDKHDARWRHSHRSTPRSTTPPMPTAAPASASTRR